MAVAPDTADFIIDLDAPILVTGGAGFVGSKLLRTLQDRGFRNVRCLVRSSSSLQSLDQSLNEGGRGPRIEFVRGNLLSRADCEAATRRRCGDLPPGRWHGDKVFCRCLPQLGRYNAESAGWRRDTRLPAAVRERQFIRRLYQPGKAAAGSSG